MRSAPKTILVVEDDSEFRSLALHILKGAGYRVESAPDGPAGLAAARELKPDLILLDVEMPGMDGYGVCKEVRADPAIAHVPIILVTVHSEMRHLVEGLKLGADDHVTKPFDPSDLLLRVASVLKRRDRPD